VGRVFDHHAFRSLDQRRHPPRIVGGCNRIVIAPDDECGHLQRAQRRCRIGTSGHRALRGHHPLRGGRHHDVAEGFSARVIPDHLGEHLVDDACRSVLLDPGDRFESILARLVGISAC